MKLECITTKGNRVLIDTHYILSVFETDDHNSIVTLMHNDTMYAVSTPGYDTIVSYCQYKTRDIKMLEDRASKLAKSVLNDATNTKELATKFISRYGTGLAKAKEGLDV